MSDTPQHRSGFVTLVGRPNVGKSTLLNALLGEKIAITSPRPQTTRNRIPGVLTREGFQLVFVDTPGLHHAKRALNRYMNNIAEHAATDTDALALLIEAGVDAEPGETEAALLAGLEGFDKPVYLVINKVDAVDKARLLPQIETWSAVFPFAGIVPVSALRNDGVDHLVEVFAAVMPEGPPLYPADALTDLPERFIAAELVRERAFYLLQQELPYSTAVTIEAWRERAADGLVEIDATLHVERDSQKGIVIGKGGQMIKAIGTEARASLERLLGTRVHLKLFVRVEKAWTRSPRALRKLGYE